MFGKMRQQFPVNQYQIYFKEEEGSHQGHNSQGGSEAEGHTGVEGAVVGCRKKEADKFQHSNLQFENTCKHNLINKYSGKTFREDPSCGNLSGKIAFQTRRQFMCKTKQH